MEFAIYTISVKGFFNKHYEVHLNDELKYMVRKPSFWTLSEYIFFDTRGHEVLRIKKKFALLSHKFIFSQGEKEIATFEKSGMDNFYTSTSIHGKHTVQGNLFGSEFTVYNDDGEIAKVSRKRFRSTNKYGIAIIKGNNELYVLGMIIAISMVHARKKKKA